MYSPMDFSSLLFLGKLKILKATILHAVQLMDAFKDKKCKAYRESITRLAVTSLLLLDLLTYYMLTYYIPYDPGFHKNMTEA